jgi:hypothetical protein
VVRTGDEEETRPKRQSMGFLASFLSCGIVIGFNELINHEGDRKVTDHLLTMIKMGAKIPNALIYDAACSLKLFWNRNYGGIHLKETPASKILFNTRLAVDRFHRKNHVHPMCNTITNPDCALNGNNEIYKDINTGIAEQSFRYLSEFKLSLRRLAFPTSTLFSFILLHLWNCRQTKISPDSYGLASKFIGEKVRAMFVTYCIFETTETGYKEISEESMDVDNTETDGIEDDNGLQSDNGSLEQLNYDCFVELNQYEWDLFDEDL